VIREQPHIAFTEHPYEAAAHAFTVGGEHLRTLGQQDVFEALRVVAALDQQPLEPILRGERQFHAAGAAPDHPDTERPAALGHPLDQALPASQEGVDGLHGQREFSGPGDIDRARPGAGIDGQQVEVHRRAAADLKHARFRVEPLDLAVIEPGAGETCQRTEVDMAFVKVVMSGDVAGQHAGVGGMDVPCDQRQAQAGEGAHAKTAQHRDVGVAAADQHQVLRDGRVGLLHQEISLSMRRVVSGGHSAQVRKPAKTSLRSGP
jgi:hypothetical protein